MMTRSKVLLTVAVAVPMVLGGAGTAYAAHYQDRALPGSTVGGASVAGLTRDEVTDLVTRRAGDVTVTLTAGSTTRTAHLADLGYRVDVAATVDAVFAANTSWKSYATSLVSSREVDAVVASDPATVDDVVADLVTQADKAGRSAAVKLAPSKKSFVVVPAVAGQTVDPASFQEVADAAARRLTSATSTVAFVDTDPKVTTAAATSVADAANALVKRSVKVSDGEEQHAASATEKASWITIPTADGVPGAPTVDSSKVKAWVEKVADSAQRDPTNGVRNLRSDGTVATVVTEARDGRTVKNADALATAAVAALSAKKTYSGTFDYDTVAATWTDRLLAPGAENLAYPATDGEKWIDVDLGKHTMTAYVGSKVVYGPITMVAGAKETPSVTGTYRVYVKYEKLTMRGTNADGTKYETPDVPWVSFFYRGYGLHGAPWRSTFGYDASHGCINLPVSVAKWVYDFAPIGTPVTSHY
jgi:lipoprotein-anchoring transpeptidase ErfK/SrfK